MNELLDQPTSVDDPTPALRAMGQLARGYSRLFTESRIADRLSPPRPVRRAGYDARLEVVAAERVADDVVSLTLSRADRSPLPAGRRARTSMCSPRPAGNGTTR